MNDDAPPTEKERMSRRRMIAIGALFFALVAIYRVFGIYTVRSGSCVPRYQGPVERTTVRLEGGTTVSFPRRPMAAPRSILVMSYNTQGHASLIRTKHLEEIAQVIVAHKPDIVGLQEVHRGTWQSKFRDQMEELSRYTGMQAHYGRTFSVMGGEFGNAILTRGRIVSGEVSDLPCVGEPRSLLKGTIELDGNLINFYVTHLAAWGKFTRESRTEQVECIAEHLKRSEHPYIIVGDFNIPQQNPELAILNRGDIVQLGYRDAGPTHKFLKQQLDYIYSDPGWHVKSARVLNEGPSDHWPLIAELDWQPSVAPQLQEGGPGTHVQEKRTQ